MIKIKPHHFVDMIKLYGTGLEFFIPDESYGHNFYGVGNEILKNPNIKMQFTMDCDDVCMTCKFRNNNICADTVTNLGEYISKDSYNKMIDGLLVSYLDLDITKTYTAKEYCELLYNRKEVIFDIWTLEPPENTKKRYNLFCEGCRRYLGK